MPFECFLPRMVASRTDARNHEGARFLIFPSEWSETFGLTIIEAFGSGVPVIASRLGAVTES